MLKNYKELKERHSQNRNNVKSDSKVFRKQTLESWTPGILGPSSPTKLEKKHIFYFVLSLFYIFVIGFKSINIIN